MGICKSGALSPGADAGESGSEQLGFDGIWVFDHFQPYPARDDSLVLEAWTTLAALSQVTSRAVLGTSSPALPTGRPRSP